MIEGLGSRYPVNFSPLRPTGGPGAPAATAPTPGESVSIASSGYSLRDPNGKACDIPLGAGVKIGRLDNADLSMPYNEVSRNHATMRFKDGHLQIRDEGSTNGTTLNGDRLKPGEWRAVPADAEISIGGYPLELGRPQSPAFSLRDPLGHEFKIPAQGLVNIGRADTNQLQLGSDLVSRTHAQMGVNEQGQLMLRDMGSKNGTQIDGQKVTPGEWQPVAPGSLISFGGAAFVAQQQNLSAGVQAAVPAVPGPAGAALALAGYQLVDGQGKAIKLPAAGEFSVGRLPDNDLPLDDTQVSRHHAALRVNNGNLEVKDGGSLNGTSINGARIAPGQWTPVPTDAKIGFGPAQFSLRGASQGLQAAAVAVGGPAGLAIGGLKLEDLRALAHSTKLETKQTYLKSIDSAMGQMEKTSGLVDLPKGIPTVVLSDIHGRRDFLLKALEHEIGGVKVFDLLKQGKVNLVCVGDGMHSEARGKDRWIKAQNEMFEGKLGSSPGMQQEMLENLGTMKMVMDLKSEFPENFQFLRGNHDEVKGNFMKYAQMIGESTLVQHWLKERMGEDFLDRYAQFEEKMPLVVRGEGFVASHAAPATPLTRQQVESRDERAFKALAWTDNRGWRENDPTIRSTFQGNLRELGAEGSRWLVGHRPVEDGNYRSQLGGQLVQINDPNHFVMAVVPADGKLQPDRDVIRLAPE